MKSRIVVALVLLAIMVASAASATTLGCLKTTTGNQTTYTYTLTSSEIGDYITSLHIYAPLSPGLIQDHSSLANWSFDAIVDPDPEVGTDIYWCADDIELYGLSNGTVQQFSITVPSWTSIDNNHILPGCLGNWGYDTESWPGYTLISFPSVSVPEGVPEPGSIMILAVGCCGLMARMRRRSHR